MGAMAFETLTTHLADDDEVTIVTSRTDGSRVPTVIWAVVADGVPYVRSVNAERGHWYRRASSNGTGAFQIDGTGVGVAFSQVEDDTVIAAVDAAYSAKYARYEDDLAAMLTDDSRACTLAVHAAVL